MRVTIETLREAREVVASARTLCRESANEMQHDDGSCACGVCSSKRLLDRVVQELGQVERHELDRGLTPS